ncbi:hypothetical protein RUM44_010942 [Polyplax serrata]|uniref:Uncharacterized protein n=1 Tax=Polyplax serrata TaxID=468196 RepID=A0ABR1ANP2_POLSC
MVYKRSRCNYGEETLLWPKIPTVPSSSSTRKTPNTRWAYTEVPDKGEEDLEEFMMENPKPNEKNLGVPHDRTRDVPFFTS